MSVRQGGAPLCLAGQLGLDDCRPLSSISGSHPTAISVFWAATRAIAKAFNPVFTALYYIPPSVAEIPPAYIIAMGGNEQVHDHEKRLPRHFRGRWSRNGSECEEAIEFSMAVGCWPSYAFLCVWDEIHVIMLGIIYDENTQTKRRS